MIKTEDEYERSLKRIEEIFNCKQGTAGSEELEQLVRQVEIYEDEKYPIEEPCAEAAAKFRAEQEG